MATQTKSAARPSDQPVRTVVINGARCEVRAATLADVVTELEHEPAAVATALDGAFVARARRAEVAIKDGAEIEIVAPRQGG